MHFENLTTDDIDQVVDIIKDVRLGFLSRMPRPFIRRYFENAIQCPRWHCRILKEGRSVLGFHVTTVGRAVPRNEPLMRTPAYLVSIAAIHILPALIIASYFLTNRRESERQATVRQQYDAELVYIAVHNDHQNRGLGKLFMGDMRGICETHGIAILGTEYYRDDPQASRFYGKYPHEKLDEINSGGRMAVYLRFNVPTLPAPITPNDQVSQYEPTDKHFDNE